MPPSISSKIDESIGKRGAFFSQVHEGNAVVAGRNSFEETVAALSGGQAAIFPTDTVYGIGVAIAGANGPDTLYELKRREPGKPVAWLVGGLNDLERYGADVPESARCLARAFWPGPLTLVVKASRLVPAAFQSAEGTIGLRMPDCETTLRLISAVGCPLATTSANFSGKPAAHSYSEVDPGLAALVPATLGDGDDSAKSGVASTVVDCTGGRPCILREGAISPADVQGCL